MSAEVESTAPIVGVICFDGGIVEFTDREAMDEYSRECERIEDDRAWRAIRVRRSDFVEDAEAARKIDAARDKHFEASLAAVRGDLFDYDMARREMRWEALDAVYRARCRAREAGR